MMRDVDNAQRSYDAVLARYMTNKIEELGEEHHVRCSPRRWNRSMPAQPKVGLISGLAVLIGAMLAAAVVFVLESMDRRVRTRADPKRVSPCRRSAGFPGGSPWAVGCSGSEQHCPCASATPVTHMLVQPTDNVLPIDGGSSMHSMSTGRHIGAILIDDGSFPRRTPSRCCGASASSAGASARRRSS